MYYDIFIQFMTSTLCVILPYLQMRHSCGHYVHISTPACLTDNFKKCLHGQYLRAHVCQVRSRTRGHSTCQRGFQGRRELVTFSRLPQLMGVHGLLLMSPTCQVRTGPLTVTRLAVHQVYRPIIGTDPTMS